MQNNLQRDFSFMFDLQDVIVIVSKISVTKIHLLTR